MMVAMLLRTLRRGASVCVLVSVLSLSVSALSACAPQTITTPGAKAAYTADQVITRLGELQAVVIDASLSGALPLADGRKIVTWISGDKNASPPAVGVLTIVQAGQTGWPAAVRAGWPSIRVLLAKSTKVSGLLPILDAMIGGLQ